MADLKLVPAQPAVPVEERPHKDVELDVLLARRTLVLQAQSDALAEANAFGKQLNEIHTEIATRMGEKKATRLPHPTFKIWFKPNVRLTKLDITFLEILELDDIPQREKDEMVTRIIPTEPILKTDAAKLKKYADQYGPEHPLYQIRERALRYDTSYALVIEPVEEPKKGLTPPETTDGH